MIFAVSAQADVIKMPNESPRVISDSNSPIRGMTKNQVEAKWRRNPSNYPAPSLTTGENPGQSGLSLPAIALVPAGMREQPTQRDRDPTEAP